MQSNAAGGDLMGDGAAQSHCNSLAWANARPKAIADTWRRASTGRRPLRRRSMRCICALLGLLVLMVPASAALPAEQPYRITQDGRLVTDVYINGQGPFSLLIDTASSSTLIL